MFPSPWRAFGLRRPTRTNPRSMPHETTERKNISPAPDVAGCISALLSWSATGKHPKLDAALRGIWGIMHARSDVTGLRALPMNRRDFLTGVAAGVTVLPNLARAGDVGKPAY